ncbi:CCA tRNA nucleotidyltransferase [Brevibacillus dissolubilis]|uniref:CCA tRNA nucleotidyltransferase n=1 Tax=Brevibacillus dissolubilis TaxID=1844116 RepID=UPI0011177E2D|nr:CCA tRNA nucleotidyltransferase [Brevibacillus dissolubilis]
MPKEQALAVLQTLEQHGYEAYFVGGCVRDWLLSHEVHDIDICTNALPGDIMNIFPGHIPTGLKHGTVTVKQGGLLFEVTTFRVEGEYEDHRRPSEVQFVTDIREDLARRDFTINAMAMDQHDRLIDPFHGQEDLQAGLIRAVGDPGTRFREDALRLLRAARFAARLGFEIEPQTVEAMGTTAPLLQHIAVERIREELIKLIDSEHPQVGIGYLRATQLLSAIPLLSRVFAEERAESEAWRMLHLGSALQKWAFLLYTAGFHPEQAQAVTALLKMSKRETELIVRYVDILTHLSPKWDQPYEVEWGKLLLDFGWDVCLAVDMLLQAFWWRERDYRFSQRLISTYEQMPVKTLKELALTGHDLQQAFQRRAGDWIRLTLLALLEQAALHGLPNTREDLLAAAKKEVEAHEYQAGDS